jgi:alpha-tubulin suppressor-like RCC1 family protein
VSAGVKHTCAVAPSGAAYCWGDGSSGKLGNGSIQSESLPARIVEPTQAP